MPFLAHLFFTVAFCTLPAPTPAASAPAADGAGAPAPAFVQHFGPAYPNLLVVQDPLPWLQKLLTSDRLRHALMHGRLARVVNEGGNPADADPAQLWKTIQGARRWVPAETAVGLPDGSGEDFGRVVRLFMLVGLTSVAADVDAAAATDEDEVAALKDFSELQQQVLRELRQLRVPGLRVWVRMRDERDTVAIMGLVQKEVRAAAGELGLEVGAEGVDALTVSVAVRDLLEPEDVVGMLAEMGFVRDEEDPMAAPMAEAVVGLSARATLQRFGDGLLLTLGTPPAAGGAAGVAELGPLFAAGKGSMLWARWDISGLIEAANSWTALWNEWADRPTGKAAAAADEENLLGDLRLFTGQLDAVAPIGSMRMWVDEGGGAGEGAALRVAVREEGAPAAPALAETGVLDLIPAGANAYAVDASSSLADDLSAYLSEFESRLESQSLKAEFGPGDPEEFQVLEALRTAYYRDLAEFRDLAHHRSREIFQPPSAALYGSGGTVSKIEVSWDQPAVGGRPRPGAKAAARADRTQITLNDLPMLELAFIGRPRDAAAGTKFVTDLYGAFADGVVKAVASAGDGGAGKAGAGKPGTGKAPRGKAADDGLCGAPAAPPELAAVRPADLGLGVETFVLGGEWISRISGEAKVSVTIEGDLKPHFFYAGRFLVFSTSPRLSKQILAAHQGGPGDRLNPAAPAAGKLVAHGRIDGTFLADTFGHFGAWAAATDDGLRQLAGGRGDPELASMSEFFAGAAELVRLIDRIAWDTTDAADGVRSTDARVTFGKE